MLKVVCNTTPIVSLLKIGQLHLLEILYSKIIIPKAVWQEIEVGKGGAYYSDLTTFPWIDIQSIQNPIALQYLTDLDQGEAEVLVLAREISANLVIIDEKLGRQYAQHFALTFTGTLGILLRAKKKDTSRKLNPCWSYFDNVVSG